MRVVIKLLVVMLTLMSLPVFSEDFTRTEAWGRSESEARHNAFIKAIEIKIGVLMLSDRESKNYEQVKNDIYAYSDGFISDYKVISVTPTETGVRIVVDSKVTTSKIKNRILIGNNGSTINGDNAVAGYNTYSDSKKQSDALLRKVLQSYPKNAYIFKIAGSNIRAGTNREMALDVKFSVTLNPDFVKNLKETLQVIENPNLKEYSSKIVIDNTETLLIFNNYDTFYLDDNVTQNVLYKHLTPYNSRVKISLETDDAVVYETCRPAATFVKFDKSKITIYAGQTNHYVAQITDPVIMAVMGNVTKIQLLMVNTEECKND